MGNQKQDAISHPKNLQPYLVVNNEKGSTVAGKRILPRLDEKAKQRFNEKVDNSAGPNACHPFSGSRTKGYGRFWLGGWNEQAHRIGWIIGNGEEIPVGCEIHHSCKNRACVNPAHLQLLSHADNMAEVHGPLSEEGNQKRKSAHQQREEITPLPFDAGIEFLAWTWKRVHEQLQLFPPPVGEKEKKLLRGFLQHVGEHRAFLSLCWMVKSWSGFVPHAAGQYGLWNTNPDWAPGSPTLSVLKNSEGIAAVVTFWLETDDVELERRKKEEEQRRNDETERRFALARAEREHEQWRRCWCVINYIGPAITAIEWDYINLEDNVKLAHKTFESSDIDKAERNRCAFADENSYVVESLARRLVEYPRLLSEQPQGEVYEPPRPWLWFSCRR
jgi:hypothetical protein